MASMGAEGVIEFLTVESLLNRSGIQFDPYHPEEWEKALGVLTKFNNLKMIGVKEDGVIVVKNWEKRQEHNLTVAERVAKSRAKKKSVTTNVTSVTSEENRIEENRIENTTSPFPRFWEAYPKRENRKGCEKKWKAGNYDSQIKEILSFIEKAKQSDRWKKGFVMAPLVFLNQERWNDDLSTYEDIIKKPKGTIHL